MADWIAVIIAGLSLIGSLIGWIITNGKINKVKSEIENNRAQIGHALDTSTGAHYIAYKRIDAEGNNTYMIHEDWMDTPKNSGVCLSIEDAQTKIGIKGKHSITFNIDGIRL